MNKVKEFFKKLAAYIKNTAWIQPILIVIVIFVILFSLNPLTNAIKKGWTNLTSINKMETISYQEYVEKVEAGTEKFVVVFTTKGDETCADLYDSMNEFLKGDTYKNGDFKVYNVSLATKSAKATINGRKYEQYKDSTIGVISKSNLQSEEAIEQDHLLKLDARIEGYVSYVSADGIQTASETENYKHITSAPLFIWYENGMETRINNSWSDDANGSVGKFSKFITEFEVEGVDLDNWNEEFDLTYAE